MDLMAFKAFILGNYARVLTRWKSKSERVRLELARIQIIQVITSLISIY